MIAPARARGYAGVWLAGASMGGMGTLLYERSRPGELDGLVLLAPYLGDRGLLEESLARVFPGAEADEQRAACRSAATRATTVVTGGPGTGKTTVAEEVRAQASVGLPAYRAQLLHSWAAVCLGYFLASALADLARGCFLLAMSCPPSVYLIHLTHKGMPC